MKVLFLDIDGVLNNLATFKREQSTKVFDPECMAQLNRVLSETGAFVVVSSTWRLIYSFDSLQDILRRQGLMNSTAVIGVTAKNDRSRGEQIKDWLGQHPKVTSWAVVDDNADMDALDMSRFVQTSMETGMRKEHADNLIRLLGKKKGVS